VVDVDDSSIVDAPRKLIMIDRSKASLLGVDQTSIVMALRTALSGSQTSYLHDASKYPVATDIHLSVADHGNLETALSLGVKNSQGKMVSIRELVTISDTLREQPVFHKDGLPVNYVVGDMAGAVDSPLYGMFAMRSDIQKLSHKVMDTSKNISSVHLAILIVVLA